MAVYLFTGPEIGEKNDTIKELKDKLQKEHGGEQPIEEYVFYATESPPSQYLSLLECDSFFSSATCVVVKEAQAIKDKADVLSLAGFAKAATPEKLLIFTSDESKVASSLEKLIPPANKKVFWEMFESRKMPYVTSLFQKKGYKISQNAAMLILDMLPNNTQSLRNECAKFFVLFSKDHTINSDDVENVLSNTKEENAFSIFSELVSTKGALCIRVEKALTVLQKIRLSKENSSVMIIATLASCFRKVALWQFMEAAGKLDDASLRAAGFVAKKQKEQYGAAAKLWSAKSIQKILHLLEATDMEIRSTGQGMEDTLLQLIIYQIMIKKGNDLVRFEKSKLIG